MTRMRPVVPILLITAPAMAAAALSGGSPSAARWWVFAALTALIAHCVVRRLARSNRAKDQFLANISHEIRTPMTAILGYAEMLLEPDQTPSARQESLRAIRRNAHHLSDLMNDVLDLSKIEAGRMTVEKIPCDLPDLIAQTVSLTRPLVTEKGLQFKLQIETPIPRQIRTDPVRVRQILLNLVANARKFTEKGFVELRVGCRPAASAGGNCTIRFSVTDSGIGMSPQQIAGLFKPFAQPDDSTCRRFGGTGLGLTICKSLANLLGGDVSVQSQPGAGSTFTVDIDGGCVDGVETLRELPDPQVLAPATDTITPTIPLHGRILLAEDGKDNQRLISLYLRRAGAEVIIVENGRTAVERALNEPFSLILMDMQMPELDGCAAVARLRERGCDLPIIALTARTGAGDRDKCLDAGFNEYLTKPIDKSKLLSTVRRYLPNGRPAPAARLTSILADDPELSDVLEAFVHTLPEKVNRLTELLTRRDLEELRQFAHQIKGAAGGYGFPPITERAGKLETQLDAASELDAITATVAELTDLIRRVEGYPADGKATTPDQRTAA